MVVKLSYTGESEPLFNNYLRPLTDLDEGLYALACEEDVCCLATLVISFKLIEVYIEHGVTALDCYIRPPRFRETMDDISDEPGSIAANRTKKMLLLTWHESIKPTKEPICHYPFEETELDGEAGFADVVGSGVESYRLSHDESFGVDDLDLNLNEPINLNVSTQEPIMEKVSTQVPIVEEVGTQEFTMEDVVHEDYVTSGENARTFNSSEDEGTDDDDDDDDDDEDLVDEENEIVEPDVDVHLFGDDVDVINPDGFDNDPGNDDETNEYRRKRLDELSREIKGVINASGQWKNLKMYKNDSVRIRAKCDGKVSVFTMSQGTGLSGPNHRMEAGPSVSSGPTTRSKKGRI
ncbi:hypothetical protein Tco_0999744 [Tanacetum coccineum]